mmetsp:Transcript_9197/g.32347  ORF Transcript_9197/g.32347 Transcript_9197/m.32347 type:complete len:245 (-) Transcript_9197:547-1281(-)
MQDPMVKHLVGRQRPLHRVNFQPQRQPSHRLAPESRLQVVAALKVGCNLRRNVPAQRLGAVRRPEGQVRRGADVVAESSHGTVLIKVGPAAIGRLIAKVKRVILCVEFCRDSSHGGHVLGRQRRVDAARAVGFGVVVYPIKDRDVRSRQTAVLHLEIVSELLKRRNDANLVEIPQTLLAVHRPRQRPCAERWHRTHRPHEHCGRVKRPPVKAPRFQRRAVVAVYRAAVSRLAALARRRCGGLAE